jgi:hypothetical protein
MTEDGSVYRYLMNADERPMPSRPPRQAFLGQEKMRRSYTAATCASLTTPRTEVVSTGIETKRRSAETELGATASWRHRSCARWV